MNAFIGGMITFINYGLSLILIDTVRAYGHDSLTTRMKITQRVLSHVSFFNCCILLILITSDFEFSEEHFNGRYSDFNEKWFASNGKSIVAIVISNISLPIVNYILIV